MLTAIGGGMMRDILLTEIPQVLRSDLYAVAALAGASTVVIGDMSVYPMVSERWQVGSCAWPSLHGDQHGRHLPVAHLLAWQRAKQIPTIIEER